MLQKYVPEYEEIYQLKCAKQGFVGDQLTVERGVNAIFEVANGFTAKDGHDGIILKWPTSIAG